MKQAVEAALSSDEIGEDSVGELAGGGPLHQHSYISVTYKEIKILCF